MIYFLPEGMSGNYEVAAFVGDFASKLMYIVKIVEADSDGMVELDDHTYDLLRDVLLAADVPYQLVINVPDVPTPRSFLFEDSGVVRVWGEDIEHELMKVISGKSELEVEKEKFETPSSEVTDESDDYSAHVQSRWR